MLVKMGRTRAALLVSIVAVTGRLPAELPPSAYKEWQATAPEILMIKVISVTLRETRAENGKEINFTVTAEVQKVERSAAKLTSGQRIEIRYSQRHYSQPIAGPSGVPALKEGQICPAYLSGDGKTYSPAAGGYSFQPVR